MTIITGDNYEKKWAGPRATQLKIPDLPKSYKDVIFQIPYFPGYKPHF